LKYTEWKRHGDALRIFEQATDLFDRLLNERPRSAELQQESANARNALAWALATAPDAKARDGRRAVELARRAVEQAPTQAPFWNTLGVARYRAGDWKESIEALNKSLELKSPVPAADGFFLAMAHWKAGRKDEARRWYDKALNWAKKGKPDEETQRFHAEAAALLGLPAPAEPGGGK
jgi:tetratricopeptide (TPR) repeat protein